MFDLLFDGAEDLRRLPLRERRTRLEALLKGVRDTRLRISEQVIGDGRPMYELAKQSGWEGVIAKRLDSIYKSGRRSPDWCKLKLVRHQTCVVGGWTEPRGTRPFFGALLLGVHDADGGLRYIGHSGAGFSDAELGQRVEAVAGAADEEQPLHDHAADQREAALDQAPAGRRSEVHRVDRRRQAASPDVSRDA